MRAVVLGANGQLGLCFADLHRQGSEVEYLFYGRTQLDISDPEAYRVLDEESFDVLINCAAYTQVDQAETERELAYRINVKGPEWMGQYAAQRGVSVIHISTDYIFAPASSPIDETHPIQPINYYGQTKWEGEEALRLSGARHLILRTSWLYSEHGHNFVKTMLRLAKDRPEISVVDDQTGSPTYARDLAEVIDHIILHAPDWASSVWGTYHFANKGAVTWYQFACEILKSHKVNVVPIPTSFYPTPASRPAYSVLDSGLFETTFRWAIPDWKEALERCLSRLGYHGNSE